MQVTFLCDCGSCNSLLVEFGGVVTLFNVPCNVEAYALATAPDQRLSPNTEIHCIVATTARGLENLELLWTVCDVSAAFIVCTTSVYTIASLFFQQWLQSTEISAKVISKGEKTDYTNYIKSRRLYNNLRVETKSANDDDFDYEPAECLLTCPSLVDGGLLHTVSYHEELNLTVEVDAGYPYFRHLVDLKLVATPSGFSLGSSNWLLTCAGTTLAIYGESVSISTPTPFKPFDALFIASADLNIISSGAAFTSLQRSQLQHKITTSPNNGRKFEQINPNALVKPSEYSTQLATISETAIEAVLRCENVIIPIDPFGECIFNLLESLEYTMMQKLKQHQPVYVYCLGDCMKDLFNFATKSAEWVRPERSEYTMHHENPTSPFPIIENMRDSNRLFFGDTLDDIKNVFRAPCVVITAVFNHCSLMPFIKNRLSDPDVLFIWISEHIKQLVLDRGDFSTRMLNLPLESRMPIGELINMLPAEKPMLLPPVFSDATDIRDRLLNAQVGNAISLPLPLTQGVIKVPITRKHVDLVLKNSKRIPGDIYDVVAVDTWINDKNILEIKPIQHKDSVNGPRIMFGTVTVDQLVKQLSSRGIKTSNLQVTKGTQYPIMVHLKSENIKIILEAPNQTIIEADNAKHLQLAASIVQELLTLV